MRFLSLILFIFSLVNAHAFESFSYSGRLVNNNGSPVTGYAKLSFELSYSSNVGAILCVENVDNVSLLNGVFHVGLKFSDCDLIEVIKNTPDGQTLSIRVIDRTQTSEKAYSFQAIHSLPYAFVSQTAKQLDQMGATPGQVLNWEDGEWKPKTITAEITDGSVTNDMLSGNILRSKISAGIPNEIVVNDLSGNLSSINLVPLSLGGTGASDAANARANLGAMAFTDVPNCLAHQKLQMNPGPVFWSCANDEATDNSKLPLSGGTLTGSLVLAADPTSSLEAATKAYVDSQVGDVNSSQWTTVGANDISYAGSASVSAIKFKLNSYQVELKANNATTENLLFILPSGKGTLGQALVTDGNGNLSWAAPAAADSSAIGGELSGTVSNATINNNTISSSKIVDSTIVDDDISPTAGIARSKISGLEAALDNKEPSLTAGTIDQYYRGDKNWQNFDTAARSAKLSGYVKLPGAVTDGDSLQAAIGKIDDSLGKYVLRDGSSVITGDFTLSNKKIINLADPTLAQDAATKAYVDSQVGDGISNINNLDAAKISNGLVSNAEFDYLNNLTGNIQTQIDSKQPTIVAGTTAQYYRGDKTWQTLDTDAVPQGTNLYFTEPLVLGTDLAGFISGAGIVSSADSILTAIQKLAGNQGNYILRDGSSVITNNLTLSNNKIIDLADPTLAQDAATKAYVDLKAGEATQWQDDGSDIYFDTGRVGIGNIDPAMPLHITSTGWGTILAEKIQDSNEGAEIHFSKSRGVPGTLLPVVSGDRLMSLFGGGSYSPTQFTDNVASIEMKAAENFTGTAQGTSIEFGTTGIGTTTRLPRMTIAPNGFVGINTTNPQTQLDVRGTLRLTGATSGYVGLAATATAGNTTYTLPSADGSDGHVLKTNGAGVLSWVAPTSTIASLNADQIAAGNVENTEFGYLDGVTSGIQSQLNSKQGTIAAGAITDFYRGDKTWQNFDAAARSALLFGYGISTGTVASGDSIQTAISKIDGNVAALQANGQWNKSGSVVSYSTGNVGIGTTLPTSLLTVSGIVESTSGGFKFPDGTVLTSAIAAGTPGSAVAWVSFNAAGTILSSFNVNSVTKTTTGRFVVNFAQSLSDTNYAVVTGGVNTGNGDGSWASVDNGSGSGKAANSVKIVTWGYNGGLMDYPETYVAVYQGTGTAPITSGQWTESGSSVYRSTGNVGIGTNTPQTALDVNGAIKIGSQPTCNAATEGTQRYNSSIKNMEFCDGTYWNVIGSSSGPPVGSIQTMMTASCPANHLMANGAAVSRVTYSALFAAIGTMYGSGDGSTTFNLPDLRGYFLRGLNAGSGSDPDAVSRTNRGDGTVGDNVGTKQLDALQQHTHYITSQSPGTDNVVAFSDNNPDSTYAAGGNPGSRGDAYFHVGNIKTGRSASETRAKNISVLYCIKF